MKYPTPILRALPLRERPLHRVQRDASACNLVELLAAVVGGSRQIEIAHDLLGRLRDLDGLAQASMEEMALSYGLGPVGAARLKAALDRFDGYRWKPFPRAPVDPEVTERLRELGYLDDD